MAAGIMGRNFISRMPAFFLNSAVFPFGKSRHFEKIQEEGNGTCNKCALWEFLGKRKALGRGSCWAVSHCVKKIQSGH